MPKAIDNARDSILTTARGLLIKEGYESLNIRTIAAASGIATGTVYNYFKAKDEIVFALMTEDWILTLATMDSALDTKLDSGIESEKGQADCLKGIYNPLRDFIHNYKGIWIILAAAPPEEKSPSVRHYDKALFLEELGLRIKRIWSSVQGQDYEFSVSFLSRSLVTYAQEGDCDLDKLSRILRKLMET